jgi:hypothetical protein
MKPPIATLRPLAFDPPTAPPDSRKTGTVPLLMNGETQRSFLMSAHPLRRRSLKTKNGNCPEWRLLKLNCIADLQVGLQGKRAERSEAFLSPFLGATLKAEGFIGVLQGCG